MICLCDSYVNAIQKLILRVCGIDVKNVLEIRQVLDPDPNFDIEDEDTYPDFIQHGYWEHSNFHKLNTD